MFCPVDIHDSSEKIAPREDLEPHFIQFEIKATVTKTDNFVALEQEKKIKAQRRS